MKRRSFLKIGTATLAVAGAGLWGMNQLSKPDALLSGPVVTAAHTDFLNAVGRVVLAGVLPADPEKAAQALTANTQRLGDAVATLTLNMQAEVGQLLNLFSSAAGRRFLAGVKNEWAQADSKEVSSFLEDLRFNPIPVLQPAYHALHDLTLGSWYSVESSWDATGYPGPPFKIA